MRARRMEMKAISAALGGCLFAAQSLAVLFAGAEAVLAESFPARPIRLIVPVPAGAGGHGHDESYGPCGERFREDGFRTGKEHGKALSGEQAAAESRRNCFHLHPARAHSSDAFLSKALDR